MADEICLTCSLTVYKSSIMAHAQSDAFVADLHDMSGSNFISGTISVGITAEAIPMGDVTAPHWAWFHNKDSTNFIKIRNGSSGADVIKLLAGERCAVPLLDSGTYYAIADTAACIMYYRIYAL